MTKDNIEFRDYYFEDGNQVFTRRFLSERAVCCQSVCRHCPWYYSRPKPAIGVVSLVPSWTETLLDAGINVLGRTRFCIHPKERLAAIPVVGGTKKVDFKSVPDADFLLVDREENTREIAQSSSIPLAVTHVQSLADLPAEIGNLAEIFESSSLQTIGQRWEGLLQHSMKFSEPPVIEWGRRAPFKKIIYVIWKNPWMCVSENTFIGSVLEFMGFQGHSFDEKYPEIDLDSYDESENLILFSSEPYPFLQKKNEIQIKNASYAFVDGELYSWFGIRSLKFLESLQHKQ